MRAKRKIPPLDGAEQAVGGTTNWPLFSLPLSHVREHGKKKEEVFYFKNLAEKRFCQIISNSDSTVYKGTTIFERSAAPREEFLVGGLGSYRRRPKH